WAFVTAGPVSRSGTKNVAPAARALAMAEAAMSPPAGRARVIGRSMASPPVAVPVGSHGATVRMRTGRAGRQCRLAPSSGTDDPARSAVDDQHFEVPRPVHALDALQLDVARRRRAADPRQRPERV